MAKRSHTALDEMELTKGQLRKLNALRKSVGTEIGERAFGEWLESQPASKNSPPDKKAALIAITLWDLVEAKRLTFPRGGYLVRRGRGRVIVEWARSE